MNTHTTPQPTAITDELRQLVIARLNLIPPHVTVSIGSEGEFSRGELIQRVSAGDRVGREVVRSELEFLRALADGTLLDEITHVP